MWIHTFPCSWAGPQDLRSILCLLIHQLGREDSEDPGEHGWILGLWSGCMKLRHIALHWARTEQEGSGMVPTSALDISLLEHLAVFARYSLHIHSTFFSASLLKGCQSAWHETCLPPCLYHGYTECQCVDPWFSTSLLNRK